MATKPKRRRARKIATEGMAFAFHGAFKTKAAAQRKARSIKGGFYRGRLIKHGDYRYVVMGPGSGVGF